MDSTAFRAVLYSYPVCLAITLLTSHLILYHSKDASVFFLKANSICCLLWYLQALICLTLVISIFLALLATKNTIDCSADSHTIQAQIVSYIGVLFYFSTGLLPDPDGPFQPKPSNFQTWILASLFEITIISMTGVAISRSNIHARLETSEVAISVMRSVILLVMILAFLARTSLRWKVPFSPSNGQERESLLGNSTSSTKYDELLIRSGSIKDAQSTGWLDYVVGFNTLFLYIWPIDSPKQQALTLFCFLLMVAQRIVNVLVPWQLGRLIDALGKNRMPAKEISLYCLYRGLQGQQGVIGSVRAILWIPISQSIFRRLTCTAFEHVLQLSLDFHLSKRVGEVMSALGKGSSLSTFLDSFAFQLFPMIFDLAVAAIYLFLNFDAFYSIITIGVMWSYVFATIYMAKYRGRARRKMTTQDREMDAAKTDAIMAYETVHHNCAVLNELTKFRSLVCSFQRAEFAVLLSLNSLNALQNLIFMFGIVLVSVISAHQISQGLHKVSDFVSLLTYFAQLHAPLAFFGSFYNQCQNNLVDAERMLDLLKHKPDVQDGPNVTSIGKCHGKVSFHNVHFAYNEQKPALENISFSVDPGTKTAIVGESGCGKSTILKLLFRFYNPTKGSIRIDDNNVSKLAIQSIRNHIGVVPQDTILFNDSIMYNLLYACPRATCQEVYQACEAASIHHRILAFSEGYDTLVGERGLKLSGGEKQRVSIARAILKQPQIMLLDEATASLDSHTERQVQEALENVTRGRTTITIAHRLSTITQSDQILVLHDGHIVESGCHNDLLSLQGRYWTMWERQTTVEEKEKANFEI